MVHYVQEWQTGNSSFDSVFCNLKFSYFNTLRKVSRKGSKDMECADNYYPRDQGLHLGCEKKFCF